MAELDFVEHDPPKEWKPSNRCSRKSGCSNIFSGVNLHQLQRLFRAGGNKDAEQRARLVWREVEKEEVEDEAGLAQALVGLRLRARSRAGTRAEGHRERHERRAVRYFRAEEFLHACTAKEKETAVPSSLTNLQTEDDVPENQNHFKPWRLEAARDPERYLHRTLH